MREVAPREGGKGEVSDAVLGKDSCPGHTNG
jgi:hypothetical protein